MDNAILAFQRWTGRVLQLIAGIAVLVLLVQVLANAASRQLRNAPIDGTLEYVGNWYLPIIVLLGLLIAQQKRQHIEAELLFDRAPRVIQREFQLVSYAATTAIALIIAWYGYVEAVNNYDVGLTAGVSGIVVWPVTFAVPLGFVLFAIQIILDAVALVRTGEINPAPVNAPAAAEQEG